MAPKRRMAEQGFRQNRKALKALKDLVSTGATEGIKPKVLKESREIFDSISFHIFRDTLNRLRREQRLLDDDKKNTSTEELSRRVTCDDDDAENCMDVDGDATDMKGLSFPRELENASCSVSQLQGVLRPDYLLATWKEKATKRTYVSVAVILPSGSEQLQRNFRTSIEGHDTLTVRFQTPLAFRKSEVLHEQWIHGADGVTKIEEYHPRVAAFQEVIDERKRKQGLFRENTAQITLPFTVRPRLTEKFYLGW